MKEGRGEGRKEEENDQRKEEEGGGGGGKIDELREGRRWNNG